MNKISPWAEEAYLLIKCGEISNTELAKALGIDTKKSASRTRRLISIGMVTTRRKLDKKERRSSVYFTAVDVPYEVTKLKNNPTKSKLHRSYAQQGEKMWDCLDSYIYPTRKSA